MVPIRWWGGGGGSTISFPIWAGRGVMVKVSVEKWDEKIEKFVLQKYVGKGGIIQIPYK